MAKTAAIVNYQIRGAQFAVGDVVYPFLDGSSDLNGRVVAVWPAIGMVDVEWPHGSERLPVEDIQKISPDSFYQPPEVAPGESSVPGGAESVPVSTGPSEKAVIPEEEQVTRLTAAFIKKAVWQNSQLPEFRRRLGLYWASRDRRYRARKIELGDGVYHCPKCAGVELRKAIYKRRAGESLHLLGCPNCLFLIKKSDIIGDPTYTEFDITPNRKRRL